MHVNGELKVGTHVIFHHNRRNEDLDALVLVIFQQNGPPPALTLITIRPGERGPSTKTMIPHRDDNRKSEMGWWCFPDEVELDS